MRSTGSIQRTWRICTTWMSLKWKRGRKGWKGWKGRYLKPQTKPTAKLRPQQWSLKRSKRPGLYGWSKIHAVSILQSAEIDLTMWWLCDLSTNLSSLDIAHMSKKSKTSPWPDSGQDLCQRRCPPATSAPTPRLRAGESPGFHEQIQYPYNTEPLKFLVYGYTVWVPFRIFLLNP